MIKENKFETFTATLVHTIWNMGYHVKLVRQVKNIKQRETEIGVGC